MRKVILTIALAFLTALAIAQPANDNCTTAQNLGTLATPPGCVGTAAVIGAATTVNGTLVGATEANPYIYQSSCVGGTGTMAIPANDVWYTFTASAYTGVFTVNSSFPNPNIAMYSGTCGALGGGVGGCAISNGTGSVTLTVEQMVIGTTYYLQVSGNTGETGTFTLSAQNNKDCADCLTNSTLTVNPLPVNGAYNPGTTVNFCYHVGNYTHINTNWLHGVQLNFGNGWNPATLTPVSASAVSTNGSFLWFPNGIGVVNGVNWGTGWYWDDGPGGDGIASNNFGDAGVTSTAAQWNFCWNITTDAACTPGADLSVDVNTSGDGESGSWSSSGCLDDPTTSFNAVTACCPPGTASTPETCAGNDGTITITPVGALNPYTYNWAGPGSFTLIENAVGAGPHTITGLAAGTYTLTLVDKNNCQQVVTIVVGGSSNPTSTFTQSANQCLEANSFNFTNTGSTGAGVVHSWIFPSGTPAMSAATSPVGVTWNTPGTYTITHTVSIGACTSTTTSTITVFPMPVAAFSFVPPVCTKLVNFTNSSSIPSGSITNYAWNFGDPLSGSNTLTTVVLTNPSHTFVGTGALNVTLTVTSNNGCIHDTIIPINISASVIADFTSTAPVCLGSAITFTSISTTPAGTISNLIWDFENDGTGDGTGTPISHTYVAAATYTVELVAINSFGCRDSITHTVVVNPNPTPSFTAAGVCFSNTTSFVNTTPAVPAVTNWHWDFGVGAATNDTSNVQSPTFTYPAAGVYTVSLTAYSGTCSTTVTRTDTVHPKPVAAFTATNSCIYNAVSFTNTTPNPGPNDNIASSSWNFGGAAPNTSVLNSPSHLYTTDGTYNVSLIVTTNHGCKDTVNSNVTIYPKPVADFTATTVCFGNNTTLTDASTVNAPDNIAAYCWDTNSFLGTCENNTAGPVSYAAAAGTNNVSLIVTSNNGCIDTITKAVTVYPKPVASFTFTNVCNGVSSNFVNTSSGTIASTDWDWDSNGTFTNTGSPATQVLTLGPNNVTMITTTTDGCKDTMTNVVTVHPLPIASFTSDSVCINSSTTLTNTSTITAPDAISLYFWDMNNDGSVEYFSSNASHAFTPQGNHPVELMVVSNFGCKDSIVGNVFVHAAPVVNITSTPVCLGFPTVFSNTTTVAGGTIQQVDWNFGGPAPNTLTQVNPPATASFTYGSANNYTVTLTATSNAGCVTAGSIQVTVNPKPNANFSYATTCEGSLMSLSDLSSVASGVVNALDWSVDNGATASILQNPSLSVGTSGNHNVTLIATTNHGCKDTVTNAVYVNPNPVPTIVGDDLSGCALHCVNFTGGVSNVPGATVTNWAWNFGNSLTSTLQNDQSCYTSNSFTANTTYDVTLTLTTDSGCVGVKNNLAYITVNPTPVADFTFAPTEPAPDINEPLVLFTNLSIGADHSYWNFGDAFSDPALNTTTVVNPQHFYYSYEPNSYVVTLAVDNNYGCVDTIRKTVEIKPDFSFFIPNAFSPNGDGINDGFNGKGIGIAKYEIWIFDRWGNMIWYADSIDKLWDGKVQGKDNLVQQDVYVWKVKFKDILNKGHEYHGTVTVVR